MCYADYVKFLSGVSPYCDLSANGDSSTIPRLGIVELSPTNTIGVGSKKNKKNKKEKEKKGLHHRGITFGHTHIFLVVKDSGVPGTLKRRKTLNELTLVCPGTKGRT